MERKITWQLSSTDPENATNLDAIRQWWANLRDREISWQQRILPPSGNPEDLDWESTRFDEVFVIASPELRGITLYWHKPGDPQERNITARKLELDRLHACLYVYSQAQQQVILRVALPQVSYQTLELKHPQVSYVADGDNRVFRFRDADLQMEVKVILSAEEVRQLQQSWQ
ncbi:MAG TPA: hypothetical protein IGS17_09960 [Oscillatoriales cyanobacterium M59_W2019_021]|nr:MAG: hypothetical protein D6728_17715 [Cyanobacteria bacterium J055]HIK30104.1 hypothetical protein [Oscillatoriales cyanobacterium M4454_W2019_049]HIK51230.1 hypothetical protein [Oscillatoriales cyanobacterium M59_W2019_021]